jgi:uncharacterized membrane protein YfcA
VTNIIQLVLLVSIVFLSTFLRAAFGFGNALIAMPLLILLLGVQSATPLVALVGIAIAVLMLFREWRELEIKDTLYLLLSSLAGIPVGLFFLVTFPEAIVKGFLGLLLVGFGVFSLLRFKLPLIENRLLAIPFGFISGIFGGAYNTNGPPIVIYGLMRDWNKEKFRATLQGYFLLTGGIIAIGHGLSGLWSGEVGKYFLISIPVVILGVLAGEKITAKISGDRFNQALNIFLIFLGVLMFI